LRVGTSDRQSGHISLQKTRKTGLPRNASSVSGVVLYHFVGSVIPRVGTAFLAASGAVVAGRVTGSDGDALGGTVVETAPDMFGVAVPPHPASTMSRVNAANGTGVRRRRRGMDLPFSARIKSLLIHIGVRTQKDGQLAVVIHLLYHGILTIRLRADHLTDPLDDSLFVRKLIALFFGVDDRSIHCDLEDATRGG